MKILSYTDIQEILALDLKRVLNTEVVYKYAKFETGINDILINGSLKFSNPIEFNDPFDCNENLIILNHNMHLVESVLKTSTYKKLSRVEKRKIKRDIFVKRFYRNELKKERNRFKLSCFSTKNDEVLMWSHYADMHRGICIGFNFPHKYDEKFILCPIKYLKSIVPLDGSSDLITTLLYWQTTKSIRWKYEDEIRAITKSMSNELIEFRHYDKKFVREIVFGCKVSPQKIDNAIGLLRKNGYELKNIEFKRMEIDEETFLLKEIPI